MKRNTKAFYRMEAVILLLSFCLGLVGCGRQEEPEGLRDIWKETEQVSYGVDKVDTSDMIEYAYLGSQYWQGERIQIWGERRMTGCSIYLHREDGSRELLAEGVDRMIMGRGGWWIDSEKNIFVVNGGRILRIDSDGGEVFNKEMEVVMESICQLEDGRYIVLTQKSGMYRLAELDPDFGSMTEFKDVQLNKMVMPSMITAEGNRVLLLEQEGIWDVNLADGTVNCRISFQGTTYALKYDDITSRVAKEDFRLLEDGRAELLWSDGTAEFLENGEVSAEKDILVLRTSFPNSWLKEQVVKFNQENTDYYVMIEECEDDFERFCERTDMNLGVGKGADIISSDAVSDEYSLLEKGAFEDLSLYMEASGIQEESYFPAAFSGWKYEDGIYGMSYIVDVTGLWMKKEVIGDADLNDLQSLLDLLSNYNKDAVFSKYCDAVTLLDYFLRYSENLCGMVDLENGTCDFSGEQFKKLLETAKEYEYNETKETLEAVAGGLYYESYYSFFDSKHLEQMERVSIGYWFDDGWHTEQQGGILAINSNSSKKEGAWEFLKFMLSEDVQVSLIHGNSVGDLSNLGLHFPVNKAAFEMLCGEHLDVINGGRDTNVRNGYDEIISVTTGLTENRKRELEEALENARHIPFRSLPLRQIILEEAEAYFSGIKTIDEVRDLVENRVQLFLNERN